MISRDPSYNPSISNPDVHLQGVQYERNVGAEYGEHIKNTGAICNTSASHTYGNVMSVIEKYILDLFPSDLFKTVTASTTLASRQVTHLPKQLHKKELPMMVLIPRIMFGQDDNRFLANTQMNDRFTNTHAFYGDGSLLPLAEDPRKRIYVHGHYNRAVMYIDVIMTFNTYAEQINYMSYIHNMIPVNHNQFIRAPLELYLPEEFCKLVGNITKIDVHDQDNSVYKFLTYMNSIWHHPITYKLKGGSNTDEFFMYYIADIDTVFQTPEAGAGIKDGQIHRGYNITFSVRCEFNTIGYLTLNSPDIKKQIHVPTKDDQTIVPIFSDVINLDDFDLPVGWTILGWPIFKLKHGENSISIDNILNQSLRIVIDHHLKLGIPMERFIKVQFRENGQILDNELFYIDWTNRRLVLSNPNHRRTYRLIISVSHDYINNLIKELYQLE
jgi:hypothetical protein